MPHITSDPCPPPERDGADPWPRRLRRLTLHEHQIMGTVEAHAVKAPERLRDPYILILDDSRKRLDGVEAALCIRGAARKGPWLRLARLAGRVAGRLTGAGGVRRLLAVDIDGLRRLEEEYIAAWDRHPPADVAPLIARSIGELETCRSTLVAAAADLLNRRGRAGGDTPARSAR